MDPPPPKATATTGNTTLLRRTISLDTTLSQYLHYKTKPLLPHFLFLLLELSADFRLFFPISLSLLLAPNSTTSSLLRRPFISSLLLGLLLDLILIALIKLLFRRSRPLYNKNMNAAVSVDHFSFPSGHASRVFFVAALAHLSDEAKLLNWVVLVIWLWAVLTSLSRVFLGRHFVFDVFAGAYLGVLEALFAFRFLRF